MFRKCTAAYYKTIQMHTNQESFILTTHLVIHDMLPIHDIKRGEAFPSSPRLKSCSFLFVSQNRVQYKPAYFFSSPCLVVGNPVFLLIFCFAAVIPTALFQEKLNPRIFICIAISCNTQKPQQPRTAHKVCSGTDRGLCLSIPNHQVPYTIS